MLITLLLLTMAASALTEKVAVIDKFHGICPEFSNLPIQYQQFKLGRNSKGAPAFNMSILVREDVAKPLKMELVISRCEKNDKSKCTGFKTVKKPNYCAAIEQEDQRSPLYHFFHAIKPRWRCPIRKGIYKATEASLDLSVLLLMKVEDYHWKIKSKVLEQATGKPVLCILAEIHFDIIKE